jgi:hypothetical protein
MTFCFKTKWPRAALVSVLPSLRNKFGNPLKCSVELSQILICLMHGRSFWRGGAQPYAYLVGPTVGDYFSVRQFCRCRAGSGVWTKAKPLACNPASGFAVSDLPYSAADSRDLRQTKWVNSGPRKSADVRFGSKADMTACPRDVRFTPKSGHQLSALGCPLCARSGHNLTRPRQGLLGWM